MKIIQFWTRRDFGKEAGREGIPKELGQNHEILLDTKHHKNCLNRSHAVGEG